MRDGDVYSGDGVGMGTGQTQQGWRQFDVNYACTSLTCT